MHRTASKPRIAFGRFEADLSSEELWRAGIRVKLQGQPFRVLAALLERPGEIVTREELQSRLWGKNTTVDFDQSLSTAINKIREALGDSAENPRFVETLSRKGYRFIAPVNTSEQESLTAISAAHSQSAIPTVAPANPTSSKSGKARDAAPGWYTSPVLKRTSWIAVAAFGITVLAALGLGYLLGSRKQHIGAALPMRLVTDSGRIESASSIMESFPATVTDGVHLYATAIEEGRSILVQVSTMDGSMHPLTVPDEVVGPELGDISPDHSKLLLHSHLSYEAEESLWIVPVSGGSAQRVANVLAHDATWMPNGTDVLYATGNKLVIAHLQDGTSRPFATVPGRAFWLRWSPDGKRLRFTIFDPIAHTQSLWELTADNHVPLPLLRGWNEPASECCGVWTADGSSFIFQSVRERV